MTIPLPDALETYTNRPAHYLGLWREHDWAVKGYAMRHALKHLPDAREFEALLPLMFGALRGVRMAEAPHGQAFAILHEGREGTFLVLCWWGGENMLYRRVWLRTAFDGHFDDISDTQVVACVWELAVIEHERTAWLRHVLMQPQSPDTEAYLYDSLLAD